MAAQERDKSARFKQAMIDATGNRHKRTHHSIAMFQCMWAMDATLYAFCWQEDS